MNVRSMEYIDAIAREGNLTAAGKSLGVSQPSLSAFLSSLEEELGAELFWREKKQLIPTPAGKIYIQAARRILQVRDQTLQSITQVSHPHTAHIIVGATPLRGSVLFASIFPAFSRRYPDVRLEIREGYMGELRRMVRMGEVNCSFGSCCDSDPADIEPYILSREEIVLGVPAFHPLAALASPPGEKLASIDVRQFADSPFLLLAPGTAVRAVANDIFSKEGMSPTVVFETNNNLVLVNMIRQGAGVGLLPLSAKVDAPKEAVYFSLQPRYYLSLSIFFARDHVLSEAERYLVYLAMKQDMNNPLYTSTPDSRVRAIYKEFRQPDAFPIKKEFL